MNGRIFPSSDAIDTTEDRSAFIDARLAEAMEDGTLKCAKHALRNAKPTECATCKMRQEFKDHIARLRLIFKPFPVVRRIGTGSALPWSGVIVNDLFGQTSGGSRHGAVGTMGGDDGTLVSIYERLANDEANAALMEGQ